MIYEFEVPGNIVGKARPRINTTTGITYTPTKTKDYECLIEQYFMLKYPKCEIIKGRTKVEIKAYFKVPKNSNKKQKEEMLNNIISPIKKPDIDNIIKIVLDSMNKFAFNDDNQISKINVEKFYAEEEKIYIKIEEY